MNSPERLPDLRALQAAASRGDVRAVVAALSRGPITELPEESIRAGYEIAQPRVRNGIPEQDVAKFLQLGLSPQESAKVLARDGFITAVLVVVADHENAHPENGRISLPKDVICEGFERAKGLVRNGYSEQNAAAFLALGLSASESAELLARNGFIHATLQTVEKQAVEGCSTIAIEEGYRIATSRIRDGYSEQDAARFVALSPEAASYFPMLTQDGFFQSAYLVKAALGLQEKLADPIVNSGLARLESEPFTGMDAGTASLLELYDLHVRGEAPTELTPLQILDEIAQNPGRFAGRMRALIERDSRVMSGRLSGGWSNE